MAAVFAAGLATSMAQNVYSVNVVGYYNVTVPANNVGNGFAIVANQLTNTSGSDISAVIPPASVPNNTTIYKWNGTTFDIATRTTDDNDNPIWSAAVAVPPGTGFWIKNPDASPLQVTFVGEVLQGNLSNPLAAGFNLVGSQVPQSGDLADVLAYPAVPGSTTIYFWRNAGFEIVSRTTDDNDNPVWSGPAVPSVGEGFWAKENNALNWTRSFTVPQ